MLISHKYKIIFIHIPKTAGEAIANFIQQADPKAINKFKHKTALELKDQFNSEIWDSYYKFAVIRNPWEQAVSFYTHLRKPLYMDDDILGLQYPEYKRHKLLNPHEACMCAINESFPDYIEKIYNSNERHRLFSAQSWWITDTDGSSLIDCVIRYENLAPEFLKLCTENGVPEKKLPYKNQSVKKHYSTYYDKASKEIVTHHFKDDIKRFGYTFQTKSL